MITERISENSITVSVDANLYEEATVYKCLYWYGDAYTISVEKDQTRYKIEITKIDDIISDEKYIELINKLKIDLIDFKTRQIVLTETNDIKQILIAKAFSSFDEFDHPPIGEINDPLDHE